MPTATLLHRETTSISLKSIVEKAHQRLLESSNRDYEIEIKSSQLCLTPTGKNTLQKQTSADEGFESDIDSISLVSSDESFTINAVKSQEADSANGSACSDSDDTDSACNHTNFKTNINVSASNFIANKNAISNFLANNLATKNSITNFNINKSNFNVSKHVSTGFDPTKAKKSYATVQKNIFNAKETINFNTNNLNAFNNTSSNPVGSINTSNDVRSNEMQKNVTTPPKINASSEIFNLVDCICYTDTKYPDTLVFVILSEALVFKFELLNDLQSFYTNFSSLKAIANQKAYNTNQNAKFNLLQRTDANGVMHIEISRQNMNLRNDYDGDYEPSSIISINTPENFVKSYNMLSYNKNQTLNASESLNEKKVYKSTLGNIKKSLSTENLLDFNEITDKTAEKYARSDLKKVWNSAENLLESPKRPERRKHHKGPAPPPPTNQNILKGQFVRVNVLRTDQAVKQNSKPPIPIKPNFTTTPTTKPHFQAFKFADTKRVQDTLKKEPSWTNSMPRLLRKPRSKSETRLFTPMAYRYIDTTRNIPNNASSNAPYFPRFAQNPKKTTCNSHTISNRLFGMSSKLKEFQSVQSNCNVNNKYEQKSDPRYSSLGNLSYKINNTDGSLKSVIKKDDNKRRNEKKVTFSAFNTVQVV